MPSLTIRAETREDYTQVADVTTRAFGKEREARLVEAIRGSDGYVPGFSLVAELDGHIVGTCCSATWGWPATAAGSSSWPRSASCPSTKGAESARRSSGGSS